MMVKHETASAIFQQTYSIPDNQRILRNNANYLGSGLGASFR